MDSYETRLEKDAVKPDLIRKFKKTALDLRRLTEKIHERLVSD